LAYDFDRVIERRGTDAVKWDGLQARFGVDDAIPMWVADMDFASPPCVVEALVERARHPIYGYTLRSDAYYEAVTGWLRRRHGWEVRREWLGHSPGVVSGLGLLVAALTEPGDRVIIQPPVYYPFTRVIQTWGRQVVHNPLRFDGQRYTMDFDDLERCAREGAKMLILCSPHNPVGRVWTREELTRLGEICLAHGVLVVSDEIHSDLVYPGYRHTPFASLSPAFAENSVTCLAPSKTFNLAGLNTSVLVIPNERLRAAFQASPVTSVTTGTNVFGATALIAAYTHGDAWLDALLAYLQESLAYLRDYFASHIPAIRVIEPEGTYLVWLDCRGLGLADDELDRFMLREAGIATDEGHIFGPGGSGFQRLNIACPRSVLVRALQQLRDAVAARLAAGRTG
jgi:cystathionine beta-lyase